MGIQGSGEGLVNHPLLLRQKLSQKLKLTYQSPCLKSTLSYSTTGQLVNMGEFKERKSTGTE